MLGHISEPTLSDHKMPTVSADPDPGKTNSMGGSKAAAAGSSPKGLAENAASRSIPAKQYNILFEKRNKKQAEKRLLVLLFLLPHLRCQIFAAPPHDIKKVQTTISKRDLGDRSGHFEMFRQQVLDCVSKRVACTRFPAMVKRSPETRYIDRKGNLNKLSRVGTPSGLTHLMNRKWVGLANSRVPV